MKVDSEYRLQTTEGAAWEAEFRKRRAAARNDDPLIASRRSQLLSKALDGALGNPSVLHGDAKERRKITIHYGEDKPEQSDSITLWVRDGFTVPEASKEDRRRDGQGRAFNGAALMSEAFLPRESDFHHGLPGRSMSANA
jgi:hypothetical protein